MMLKNDISPTIYSSLNKELNFNPNNNYKSFEKKLTGAMTKHTTMKRIKLNQSKHKRVRRLQKDS